MSRRSEVVRLACSDGGEVETYVSEADGSPGWAVLYVHGLGSVRHGEKAQALEAACARRGWTFAAFDFRGHGRSTGTLLELRGSRLLADVDTVQAHLSKRGIGRLCLVGSSMGGWASAWFAVRRPEVIAACVLIAPAFHFPTGLWSRLSEAERQQWQQTGRLRVHNQWMDTELGYGLVEEQALFPFDDLAARWTTPLLLFHGMRDDVIPYTLSLEFVTRVRHPDAELRLFKSGDHRLAEFKEEMAEAACALCARQAR